MGDPTQERERPLSLRAAEFPLVALVCAIAFFVVAQVLALWLASLLSFGPPARSVADAAITFAITLATYKIVIARLGARPADELRARDLLPGLGKGIVAGTFLFASIVAVAAALGLYRVSGHGGASDIVIPLVTTAIMPAFMEELLFRGILLRWIEEFAGSWIALVLTSALFGLAHILNPAATWFSSFAIAVEAGFMLGGAYMLTRNLWMPIGLHGAWNFAEGSIFGLPVSGAPSAGLLSSTLSGPRLLSGGRFGLEASIIAIVLCAAAGSWFLVQVARNGGFVTPWWVRQRTGTS